MPRGRPTGNTLDLKGSPFGWASGSIAGGLRFELAGRIAGAAGGIGWCLKDALGTGILSTLNVGPLGRLIIGLKCPLLLLLLLLVGGAGHDAEGSELEDEGD